MLSKKVGGRQVDLNLLYENPYPTGYGLQPSTNQPTLAPTEPQRLREEPAATTYRNGCTLPCPKIEALRATTYPSGSPSGYNLPHSHSPPPAFPASLLTS